ncbi:hypothetical protein Mame01_68020 [Microbispora amethystogenes]|nr:hypothetical protein Mame01_68020 [Microbispora amethystogenes]
MHEETSRGVSRGKGEENLNKITALACRSQGPRVYGTVPDNDPDSTLGRRRARWITH